MFQNKRQRTADLMLKSLPLTPGMGNRLLQRELETWDGILQGAVWPSVYLCMSCNYLGHDNDDDKDDSNNDYDDGYLMGFLWWSKDLVMGLSAWYRIWLRSGCLSWLFGHLIGSRALTLTFRGRWVEQVRQQSWWRWGLRECKHPVWEVGCCSPPGHCCRVAVGSSCCQVFWVFRIYKPTS